MWKWLTKQAQDMIQWCFLGQRTTCTKELYFGLLWTPAAVPALVSKTHSTNCWHCLFQELRRLLLKSLSNMCAHRGFWSLGRKGGSATYRETMGTRTLAQAARTLLLQGSCDTVSTITDSTVPTGDGSDKKHAHVGLVSNVSQPRWTPEDNLR
jgi:hypothetical protein